MKFAECPDFDLLSKRQPKASKQKLLLDARRGPMHLDSIPQEDESVADCSSEA